MIGKPSGRFLIATHDDSCHNPNKWFNRRGWRMGDFIRGRVSGAGRVVRPSELRRELGIDDGAEVVFSRTDYGIQIPPLAQAIRQAQEMVRRYVPEGTSLVEDLHQARRQDATFV